MSSEWSTGKLGEFVELKRGYDLPQAKRQHGEVPLVSSSGVSDRHSVAMVKGPGVVTGRYGTIGQVFYVEDDFWPLNTTLYVRDFKGNDRKFIHYFLKTLDFHAYSDKAAVPGVNRNHLHEAVVSIPPVSAQFEIAATLSAFDDRITLLRETNATLEAIAQALFKSWFVDFDPVRAKMAGRTPEGMDEATAALFPAALEETEFGVLPKGWRIGTLDSIAALNPESWSAKHHPDRILYVDLANTKENQIEGITELAFDEAPSRARRVLRDGDVIVGTVRPGNRSFARISVDRAGLTGSTGFAVLRAHHHSDQALVYIAATRDEAIERLAQLADGGAYPAVRPEVVAGTPVVIAPESVRQAFGEVANHLLASVGSNQEQSRYLADLRDTLLPRLISGQLRLPEAQAQQEGSLA
jgi:type I restriction enzyme S subunit